MSMVLFNYTAKEITLKVVYYGAGFSGKTTNLQHLHTILPSDTRGKLISLTTEADRTLFFDFLPVDLGKIKDFNIRFQLYTVPGQVRYNATRRLVLKGADAVVFVADSQTEMREQNIESFNNMRENLTVNNIDPDDTPVVLQYNKRDVNNILSVDELNSDLNKDNFPFYEAVATEGKGVKETFEEITDVLIEHIAKKHNVDIDAPAEVESTASDMQIPEPAVPAPSAIESTVPKPQLSRVKRPVIAPPQTRHAVKPAVFEKTVIQQTPVNLDISELVSVVGDLRDVISEASNTLKDMLKKQTKISNEMYEIRKLFSDSKKAKGLRRFFG